MLEEMLFWVMRENTYNIHPRQRFPSYGKNFAAVEKQVTCALLHASAERAGAII